MLLGTMESCLVILYYVCLIGRMQFAVIFSKLTSFWFLIHFTHPVFSQISPFEQLLKTQLCFLITSFPINSCILEKSCFMSFVLFFFINDFNFASSLYDAENLGEYICNMRTDSILHRHKISTCR